MRFAAVALLLIALFLYASLKTTPAAKATKAMAEVNMFSSAVGNFRGEAKRFPRNLEELTNNSMGIAFVSKANFVDPWGNKFVYEPPGTNAAGSIGTLGDVQTGPSNAAPGRYFLTITNSP
jgi:hypothetical protein